MVGKRSTRERGRRTDSLTWFIIIWGGGGHPWSGDGDDEFSTSVARMDYGGVPRNELIRLSDGISRSDSR